MTVDATSGGTVATYDPNAYGDVGLEDIGAADVAIPRLRIIHDEAVFEDTLSKQRFPTIRAVILGLVKQRIYWDDDVEDDDKPLCKSPNFEHGFPNMREDVPANKRFPWASSVFESSHAVPVEIEPSPQYPQGWSSNGNLVLPCAQCSFKEWPKNGEKGGPPCAEQHTYPIIYTPDEGESWQPALVTFQKTGIKPSRTYLSYFAQSKQPMFTVYSELSLTQQSRGSVKYSVPNLRRLEQTPREEWPGFADQYRNIREFVRSAPRRADEEGASPSGDTTSNVNQAPAPAAAPPAAAPPASAPAAAPAAVTPTPPAASTPVAASPPAPAAAPAPAPEPASAPAAETPAAEAPAPAQHTEELPF